MTSFAQFEKDLQKAYETKVENVVNRFFKDIVITLYGYITVNSEVTGGVFGSPVLTGRFYSSHNVSLNTIDTSVKPPNPAGAKSPYPQLSLSNALAVLAQWKQGDTVYIANSLPYARKIESGAWSMKTPAGVYIVAAEAVKVKYANGLQGIRLQVKR